LGVYGILVALALITVGGLTVTTSKVKHRKKPLTREYRG
jgi:hypothetical protein